MSRSVPPIATDRFTLRELRAADVEALWPTFSDPAQCLYLSRPAFASPEELRGWLFDPEWPGRTWIAEDGDGAVAGRFVAVPAHEERVWEIGYVTCARYQRRGVARECMAALVAHLFAVDSARKLIAEVDADNAASVALIERLGFVREGLLRAHETTDRGLCDVALYGMLASELRRKA